MKSSMGVIVHIDENLASNNRKELLQKIEDIEGVLSAEVKDQRPHLMIVDYNPDQTKSMEVLSGVHNSGVNAQLVGWV
jgi:hypothetical protein